MTIIIIIPDSFLSSNSYVVKTVSSTRKTSARLCVCRDFVGEKYQKMRKVKSSFDGGCINLMAVVHLPSVSWKQEERNEMEDFFVFWLAL